jgi:hypothetical protein
MFIVVFASWLLLPINLQFFFIVYFFFWLLLPINLQFFFIVYFLFLRITQYIGVTHNACTLIPMNTRTQTLPLGASSNTVSANPQD